jgi:two-component system OmpR family response regulator
MRILVVEDEDAIADPLVDGLRREGYEVERAATGAEALDEARRPDLVLLDLRLPDIDGLDVCRRLRARYDTPVLMLTARDGVDDRVRGLDSGADDYLVKPFALAELHARLRSLARRGRPERPPVLEAGGLRLDPARREVRRGDAHIDLSAKEFALLETLMRRPGEVLSRIELVEHAWDIAYELRSNVVDVYMRRLRRKLGDGLIETVRGAGYRLREER